MKVFLGALAIAFGAVVGFALGSAFVAMWLVRRILALFRWLLPVSVAALVAAVVWGWCIHSAWAPQFRGGTWVLTLASLIGVFGCIMFWLKDQKMAEEAERISLWDSGYVAGKAGKPRPRGITKEGFFY